MTVLLVLGALLVGIVLGGVAVGYRALRFTTVFCANNSMLGNAVNTQQRVAVLQHLRRGEMEQAVGLLETELDGDIIGLQEDQEFAKDTNESVKKAVLRAKEYRAEYPRTNEFPAVDKGAKNVLNSAPTPRP